MFRKSTYIEWIPANFEKVEETASFSGHVGFFYIFFLNARVQFCQCVLRIFPIDFSGLSENDEKNLRARVESIHTEGFTSRAHTKESIEGVKPSSSGCSPAASGGGTYLYSFLRIESVKYGFDLKSYAAAEGYDTERDRRLTNSMVKHLGSLGSRATHKSSK